MPKDARDVRSALLKKGFINDRSPGDRHFVLIVGGVKTSIWTKISHGEKEIDDNLLGYMASRQMKITKRQFVDFIDCDMDGAAYVVELRQKGHIA